MTKNTNHPGNPGLAEMAGASPLSADEAIFILDNMEYRVKLCDHGGLEIVTRSCCGRYRTSIVTFRDQAVENAVTIKAMFSRFPSGGGHD